MGTVLATTTGGVKDGFDPSSRTPGFDDDYSPTVAIVIVMGKRRWTSDDRKPPPDVRAVARRAAGESMFVLQVWGAVSLAVGAASATTVCTARD